ncbi:MAG: extracellular solute-binding protein [Caldilinea sp. CFX5]|nr:extracellular solute-binding protein [Caldilinea sp. CFX5]
MNFCKQWLSLLLLSLFVAACTFTQPQNPATLQGRVLLWHAWPEPKAAALTAVLTRFQALNPDVVVKQQAFATSAEMLEQFQTAAAAGLGPDLILAPSAWIRPLQEANLIDDVATALPATTVDRFWPAARTAMRYQDGFYGLPMALDTMVLYYDRRQIEQPPTTLDELLAAATNGQLVELSTTFVDAFWGVQAFGGQLFDSEQQVILDQGGFAEWLAWLERARETPGMILEANRTALLERFIAGGVAYYVGQTSEYDAILAGRTVDPAAGAQAAIAQIGVAPLPQGPNGSAGPFLQTQGLLFSKVSSTNQRTLALALAQFMTNAEQQTTFMRTVGIIPANRRVQVNATLEPVIATFIDQVRTAAPLPNLPALDIVLRLGDSAYSQVLEGEVDPATAATNITAAINESKGLAPRLSIKEATQP